MLINKKVFSWISCLCAAFLVNNYFFCILFRLHCKYEQVSRKIMIFGLKFSHIAVLWVYSIYISLAVFNISSHNTIQLLNSDDIKKKLAKFNLETYHFYHCKSLRFCLSLLRWHGCDRRMFFFSIKFIFFNVF